MAASLRRLFSRSAWAWMAIGVVVGAIACEKAHAQADGSYASLQYPFNKRLDHFWRLLNTDRRLEMNAVGESLVRDASLPQEKVYLPAALSIYYMGADAWAKGAHWIADAESASQSLAFRQLGSSGERGYWRHWATYWLEAARCIRLSSQRSHAAALPSCDRAVAATEAAALLASGIGRQSAGDRDLAAALLMKGAVLVQAGRTADAELINARVDTVLERLPEPQFWILRRHLLRNQVLLALAQQRPVAAVAAARIAVALSQANGVPPSAPRMREVRRLLQDALVAASLWAEALDEFSDYDASASPAKDPNDRNLFSRSMVWLHAGRLRELSDELRQTSDAHRSRLGPEDGDAALFAGLAALSVPVREGAPEQALVESVRSLLGVRARSDAALQLQNRELALRAIFQKFLSQPGAAPELAFQAAESLRSSRLQRAISDAAYRSAAANPSIADLVRRLQDARGEADTLRRFIDEQAQLSDGSRLDNVVSAMRRRLLALAEKQGQLSTAIAQRDPAFDNLVRPQQPTPATVQSRLRPGEAFISIVPVGQTLQMWAIRDTAISHRTIEVSEEQVKGLVAGLRGQIETGRWQAQDWPVAASHLLYRWLFEPLATSLDGVHSLVMAVDGPLAAVPFPALLTAQAEGKSAVWPWLIRSYAISQTPSASAWLAVRQSAAEGPARRALMAWGDPLFAGVKTSLATAGERRQLFSDKIGKARGSSASETPASVVVSYADIPPLPETRDEVLAIAAAVGGDPDVDVLLGEHATRASVLAASTSGELARRRIVIFATHGLMAGDLPNLSQPALALSATADADSNPLAPLLLLEDVLSLKLNADWVILSACNTAASDGRAEEALSGLARGFFYAGARSLLVTNWAVETESAKQLSTGMFAHYSANLHASKAQSLQRSILQLLRQPAYAHPAFWAAYALVGDDSR